MLPPDHNCLVEANLWINNNNNNNVYFKTTSLGPYFLHLKEAESLRAYRLHKILQGCTSQLIWLLSSISTSGSFRRAQP